MIKGRGVPLLLLVLVLILRPHMVGDAYPFAQGLLLIPLLVAFALILLSPVSKTRSVINQLTPALLLPWALLIWSVITIFWAPDPGQGVRESITLLGGITVFTLAYWLMREEGEFNRGSIPILCLILVPVLASAVYQRLFGLDRIREILRTMSSSGRDEASLALIISDQRVFAGFLNPNMLAGFLAIGICITLDLLLTATERKRFILFSSLIAAQCAVLVLTGSVGGSMVAVVMAGAVVLVRREFRLRDMVFAGAVIALVAVGLFVIRGTGFLFGPDSSLAQRGGYMAAGFRMASLHPVLGWGSGSSPGSLMGFVAEGIRPVADPHNFLVRAWISWGFSGLLLLLAFLSFWFRACIRLFVARGWRRVPMGYAGFVFGSLAFLGHSLLDMDFFVPETALFGWCVIGATLGLAAAQDGDDGNMDAGPGSGSTILLGGVFLVLVLPVFVFYQGESLAFRAGKAATEKEFETAARLYKEARTLLPFNGRFALDEGRARFAVGDAPAADELFQKADTLMRVSPYPSWEMGRAAQAAGKWQDSIPPLETALSRYKTSPRIRIDLARAYLNLGNGEQVYTILEEVRRQAIFDPKARDLADEILSRME